MEPPSRSSRVYDWLWLFAWGIASSLWCWTAGHELGATFDEPTYLHRGLEVWRTGSHQGLLQLGTMPLPIDVETFPLYLWERWHGTRLDPAMEVEQLLPWARAGTLIFWWLLLLYARLAGRQLAGPWGGRLAVAFLAVEPTLLAHASLATTDVAVTACLVALVYHYRQGRDAGWWRRVALPAGWFAATLLAKASGLVFGPLCLLLVELEYRFRHRSETTGCSVERHPLRVAGAESAQPRGRSARGCADSAPATPLEDLNKATTGEDVRPSWFRSFRRDFVQILAGGLLLTFLYCGSDWQTDPSFVEWAQRLPDSPSRPAFVWLGEHLCIFRNAGEGLVRQIKHNMHGHGTYLLGTVADRALWYYFPLALTMKLSVPLLILPLLLGVLRPRSLGNWACLAACALLALSVTYRVQIGIRLILPVIGLAAIGLAAATVHTWSGLRPRVRCAVTTLLALGIGWTATAACAVWPNGLCYTNELWGGTPQGYRCLSDSNYDWGQGLGELARWQQQHADEPLAVWYFGADPRLASLPVQVLPFHTLPIKGPEDFLALVRGHYVAVSTTMLYGSFRTMLHAEALAAYEQSCAVLHARMPIDRTTTFLIYDFTEPAQRSAWSSASASGRVKAQP